MIGGIRTTHEMLDLSAEHHNVSEAEVIAADGINEAYERVLGSDGSLPLSSRHRHGGLTARGWWARRRDRLLVAKPLSVKRLGTGFRRRLKCSGGDIGVQSGVA